MSKNKAPSMSSLMATKGAAAPSSDVLPRGEDTTPAAPAATAPAASAAHVDAAPVAASTHAAASSTATGAQGAAANSHDLAVLLESLNKTTEVTPAQELPKVTINVKLDQTIEQKIKQIVGFQKMKRMSNFSQQDWLESRISALVELEHSQLPKF